MMQLASASVLIIGGNVRTEASRFRHERVKDRQGYNQLGMTYSWLAHENGILAYSQFLWAKLENFGEAIQRYWQDS